MVIIPDYEKGSIVNLMSSLAEGLGLDSPYTGLEMIDEVKLRGSENIILLILDGIGYEYLKEKGKDTILLDNLEGKITSVFPSSTPSAIPTFYTGLPPQQHAVTGWYTFLKEIGIVSTILPFKPRFGDESLEESGIDISSILSSQSVMDDIERKTIDVTLKKLKDSAVNSFYAGKNERMGYSSLDELFSLLQRLVRLGDEKKYIRAYWNGFDSTAHEEGVNGISTAKEFLDVSLQLGEFVEEMKDTDTTLIVTSDHGFIDTKKEKSIRLEDHLRLQECLTLPLCGDYRTLFCYVRPSKTDEFEEYWEENLSDICYLYKSEKLVKKNYFGLFKANPQLYHRIGDYTLIMKDNYIFQDTLPNEEEHFLIGHHGGISEKEMYVPLSMIYLGRD
ncbi:MAG: alkaline phosphatase family protein [Candidatus Thermoplasmatota archaeon]|nr:alkaline phosphatase family protein [Candidatus Thermoplasmatota archaeon]MBS3789659.1 alkaline phosphatase family protein [Candidatus Thermoplasmatota archaeon]